MSTETRQASASTLTSEEQRNILLGKLGRHYTNIFNRCRSETEPLAVLRKAVDLLHTADKTLEDSNGLVLELRERAGEFECQQDRARAWVEVVIASGLEEDLRAAMTAIKSIQNDPLEKLDLWLRMIEYSDFVEDSIYPCKIAIEECEADGSAICEGEYPYMDLYLAVSRRNPEHDLRTAAEDMLVEAPETEHEMALAFVELCDLTYKERYMKARYFATQERDLVKKARVLSHIAARTCDSNDFGVAVEAISQAMVEQDETTQGMLQHVISSLIVGLCQHKLPMSSGGSGKISVETLTDLILSHMVSVEKILLAKIALLLVHDEHSHPVNTYNMRKELERDLRELRASNEITATCIRDKMQRKFVQALVEMGHLNYAMRGIKRISDDAPLEQIKALAAIARTKRLAKAS